MSCHTPIKIRNKGVKSDYDFHIVPCGKCGYCRLNRVRGWIVRLNKERDLYDFCEFITLTYEVPPKAPSGLSTLRKRDFQLFVKRLRKLTSNVIKYYAVGEYGSRTRRPHYHAILFGATQSEIRSAWEGFEDQGVKNGIYWPSDPVTDAAIAYTAKYIDKGFTVPMFEGDDRQREFSLMSKRMGANYLTPQMINYHKVTLNPFVTKDGYKIPLPRYYKDKIYDEYEKNVMKLKFEKLKEEKYEKQVAAHGSELEYIRNINARLWADQQAKQLLIKQKRNKV